MKYSAESTQSLQQSTQSLHQSTQQGTTVYQPQYSDISDDEAPGQSETTQDEETETDVQNSQQSDAAQNTEKVNDIEDHSQEDASTCNESQVNQVDTPEVPSDTQKVKAKKQAVKRQEQSTERRLSKRQQERKTREELEKQQEREKQALKEEKQKKKSKESLETINNETFDVLPNQDADNTSKTSKIPKKVTKNKIDSDIDKSSHTNVSGESKSSARRRGRPKNNKKSQSFNESLKESDEKISEKSRSTDKKPRKSKRLEDSQLVSDPEEEKDTMSAKQSKSSGKRGRKLKNRDEDQTNPATDETLLNEAPDHLEKEPNSVNKGQPRSNSQEEMVKIARKSKSPEKKLKEGDEKKESTKEKYSSSFHSDPVFENMSISEAVKLKQVLQKSKEEAENGGQQKEVTKKAKKLPPSKMNSKKTGKNTRRKDEIIELEDGIPYEEPKGMRKKSPPVSEGKKVSPVSMPPPEANTGPVIQVIQILGFCIKSLNKFILNLNDVTLISY